jgi:outer membrane protein assembly factor BamB
MSSQLSPSSRADGVIGRRRALFGLGGLVVAGGLAAAGWELASPGRSAAAAGTTTGTNTGGTTGTAASGSTAWTFEADSPVRTGAVISSDGTVVYVGTDKGTVYALDAVSGRKKGVFRAGGAVSGLAMAGNTVLVGSADGKVHTFPTGTSGGALEANWTSTAIGTGISGAPTSAGGGVVYAASDDGYVAALDVNTGQRNWRTLTGKGAVVGDRAGVGPGGSPVVWAGSQDGTVYLLDASSGKVLHTFPAGGAIGAGPLVMLGSAYFGTSKGVLYVLDSDPITGPPMSVSWKFIAHGAIAGTPVTAGDAFFTATTSGIVYQVQAGSDITNQPGTALWSSPVGRLQTGPTFDNNMLYVGSDDGNLYALDPTQQGKVSWPYKAGGAIKGQILAKNNLLYFGSLDHQVYAVHE